MQISITHGTLTSIQETLSPASGYSLPTTINVSGATSSYNSTSGELTLTNLTSTMSVEASGVASVVSNITIGTKRMIKCYVGNNEVQKIYVGDKLLYEKQAPTPSGYSVDILVQELRVSDKEYLRIYDGQDTTGTLLHESTTSINGTTLNLTCLSGHLYVISLGTFDSHYVSNIVGNITHGELGGAGGFPTIFNVGSNGSFTLTINYDE